jgi:hypothetical protein
MGKKGEGRKSEGGSKNYEGRRQIKENSFVMLSAAKHPMRLCLRNPTGFFAALRMTGDHDFALSLARGRA